MKVEFDSKLEDAPPAEQTAPETTEELVPAGENLPALSEETGSQFEGEYTREDLGTKWLNLVPKSADEGVPGNFMLDRIHDLGSSIEVIVRKVKKFYLEDMNDEQNQEGNMPKTWFQIAFAEADGYRLDGAKGVDKCVPAAYLDIFVKLPEDHLAADFVVDGFGYASSKVKVKKGGYRNTVLILSRDLGGWLKGDLTNGVYTLASRLAKWKTYSWYEPTLRTAGKVTPEVKETILNGFNFFEPSEADVD